MPNIRLKNINNFICRDINLEISDEELLVLWGPTGAGKTTLLNIISGLVEYEGSVLFDDIPIDRLPIYQRKVGYLFQNLILFPHLDVRENIAYGLTIRGKPKKEVDSKVDELLRLMKLKHLAERYPKDLSGGEKQRIALARAIAASPEIMLFDEPLNSLDFDTAGYLRTEIHKLHRELGLTAIYVTHCFEEAFALADRIAVLKDGRVIRVDFPKNIFKETNCGMIQGRGYCECHKGDKNELFQSEIKKGSVLCHPAGE